MYLFDHLWSSNFVQSQSYTNYMTGVKNSFDGEFENFYWVFIFLVIAVAVVVVANKLISNKKIKFSFKRKKSQPELLFEQMLGELDLNESDIKLLKDMAKATRLRHPAVSLLSPGMLDWSRDIWIKETTIAPLSQTKIKQIDDISVKLFDQPATRSKNFDRQANLHKTLEKSQQENTSDVFAF